MPFLSVSLHQSCSPDTINTRILKTALNTQISSIELGIECDQEDGTMCCEYGSTMDEMLLMQPKLDCDDIFHTG